MINRFGKVTRLMKYSYNCIEAMEILGVNSSSEFAYVKHSSPGNKHIHYWLGNFEVEFNYISHETSILMKTNKGLSQIYSSKNEKNVDLAFINIIESVLNRFERFIRSSEAYINNVL